MKLIKILMTLCIHSNTQDIIKHGVIFKHENSLLTSNNAWKIFMKLDPKPFETLFQQVIRLEKNSYDLKESIFQFLKSDKGLQASKSTHKEKKESPTPTYPKLKTKKLIKDFDVKMAEIDKVIGLGKAIEKRRKRSISENQNPDTNDIENPSINKPIKTKLRERKFYDGQYALLNELPTVWNFFKELWNRPKSSIRSTRNQ